MCIHISIYIHTCTHTQTHIYMRRVRGRSPPRVLLLVPPVADVLLDPAVVLRVYKRYSVVL